MRETRFPKRKKVISRNFSVGREPPCGAWLPFPLKCSGSVSCVVVCGTVRVVMVLGECRGLCWGGGDGMNTHR